MNWILREMRAPLLLKFRNTLRGVVYAERGSMLELVTELRVKFAEFVFSHLVISSTLVCLPLYVNCTKKSIKYRSISCCFS